jgi:predicted nucleic acid-binding protein
VIAYLDSSAILKQYLRDEAGGADLDEIQEGAKELATSRVSYVEVRAGLVSARRARRLSPMAHDRAVTSFEFAWATIDVLEFDEPISRRAADVADTFALRAGDAIQLATALELDPNETVFVAWDVALARAARAAGMATYPIET